MHGQRVAERLYGWEIWRGAQQSTLVGCNEVLHAARHRPAASLLLFDDFPHTSTYFSFEIDTSFSLLPSADCITRLGPENLMKSALTFRD